MVKRLRAVSALIATFALGPACAVHNPGEPPLAGPSGPALYLTIKATPDVLHQDGGSQSAIVVTASDPNGRPISGLALHLEIEVAGQLLDFGTISARTIVTGANGEARAVYTAPPPAAPPFNGVDLGTRVSILAVVVGSNFGTTQVQSVDIRLYPIGVILPLPDTPTPQFTWSPTPVNMNLPVRFDASQSCPGPADSSGNCLFSSGSFSIVSYSWNFGDSSSGTGVTNTHTFTQVQTFNVTLTVTNDRGLSASKTQQVAVIASPGPTAAFVFSPLSPVIAQLVQFNADASRAAPGRTIVQYSWNYGDGTTDSGVFVSHAFALNGAYNVTLTVRDDADQKATTTQTVTVGSGNPVAVFTFSPTAPGPSATVTFDASASTAAPGNKIVAYAWTFGDGGSSPAGPTTSHAYAAVGTYTVTLTVTDDAVPARKGILSQTITVK